MQCFLYFYRYLYLYLINNSTYKIGEFSMNTVNKCVDDDNYILIVC